jgi:pimeloyl-ACP methyl ester carboxylesterase
MNPLSGQTIVFLPGIDGTGISFEPLRRLLPQDVHVKVVQYPTERLLSFEETVQCAREQIPFGQEDGIVIAESFSGPVAIALVGSGQLKAKGLILCATFARSPRPVLFKILSHLPLELFIRLPYPGFLLKKVIKGGEEAKDLFLAMWESVKMRVEAKVLAHRIKLISHMDARQWLSKITIPCLYIQATLDRTVPVSTLNDFTEATPDLRVKRIRGPHFILQAEPEASLNAIQNFVNLITNKFSESGSRHGH